MSRRCLWEWKLVSRSDLLQLNPYDPQMEDDPIALTFALRSGDFAAYHRRARSLMWKWLLVIFGSLGIGGTLVGFGVEAGLLPVLGGAGMLLLLLWTSRSAVVLLARQLVTRRRERADASRGPYRDAEGPAAKPYIFDARGFDVPLPGGSTRFEWRAVTNAEELPGEGWVLHVDRSPGPSLAVCLPARAFEGGTQGRFVSLLSRVGVRRSGPGRAK